MKIYIGDSVYLQYDGYGLILTTENGLPTDPSNEIYIEPAVFKNLISAVKDMPNFKEILQVGHESLDQLLLG